MGSLLKDLEKYGLICRFSGRIWLDWQNTAQADMAGYGRMGVYSVVFKYIFTIAFLGFEPSSLSPHGPREDMFMESLIAQVGVPTCTYFTHNRL